MSTRLDHSAARYRAGAGFTLIELLVALFIAAVIFAMGYGAINQAIKNRGTLEAQQARLTELQSAMRVLEQDCVQLTPRPIRQPAGDGWQAALVGAAASQPLLALTRGGWSNPTGLPRSSLQRVAYYFENGTLRREYWNVLDPTFGNTTFKRDLATKLKSVTFRYMDLTHQWRDQWPPTAVAGAQGLESSLRARPIAIEVTLETEDLGKLVRILEVPA